MWYFKARWRQGPTSRQVTNQKTCKAMRQETKKAWNQRTNKATNQHYNLQQKSRRSFQTGQKTINNQPSINQNCYSCVFFWASFMWLSMYKYVYRHFFLVLWLFIGWVLLPGSRKGDSEHAFLLSKWCTCPQWHHMYVNENCFCTNSTSSVQLFPHSGNHVFLTQI